MSSERIETEQHLPQSSDALVPFENTGLRRADIIRTLADARDFTLPSREAVGEIPMDHYESWFRTWVQRFPILTREQEQLAFETLTHPPLPKEQIDDLCDEYGEAWREHIPLSSLIENPEFFSMVDWEDENEAKIVNAIDHSSRDDDSEPTLFQFLTVCNIRLVAYISHRYRHRNIEYIDLVDEGTIGLKKAVEKFDYRKGNKFSTYATWWIRQSITRAIADKGRTIRIPVHMGDVIGKADKVRTEESQRLGREPSDSELFDALIRSGMDVKKAKNYFDAQNRGVIHLASLNKIIWNGEGNGSELGDMVPDTQNRFSDVEDVVNESDKRQKIMEALGTVEVRTARIIALRFGLDGGGHRTLQQVADEIGVTRERIRQIEAQGIRKLRNQFPQLSELLDG